MIAILDPMLFLPRSGANAEREIVQDLRDATRTIKDAGLRLGAIPDYWPYLWSELARNLEDHAKSRDLRTALQQLRRMAEDIRLPALPDHATRVWGFVHMFGTPYLPSPWETRLKRTILRAVLTGERVVVLVRRVEHRNIISHRVGDLQLQQITRWHLYMQPPGWKGPRPPVVPCIWSTRQLEIPWMVRFDVSLPSAGDGGRYPFCPPALWWKAGTIGFGTVRSKPAWIDEKGNGWTAPNTPIRTHAHWDVFIEDHNLHDAVGINAINVRGWRRKQDSTPGDIDHIPGSKRARFKDPGWSCE